MELAVLGPDDEQVPPGAPGQICVRSRRPSVLFDGYHGKPELTLQRLRNQWFHTGDQGSVDEDGYLRFLGRLDDVIRRGGENIRPSDVEAVLATHPAVEEVAVVGVPDDVVGQEVRAVVVAHESFDPLALGEFLDGRLPRFAWPRFVAVLDMLPKTATQKIQAGRLRTREAGDVDLRPRGGRS
jgi:crotonobetaine/carnitine-CoA ligase